MPKERRRTARSCCRAQARGVPIPGRSAAARWLCGSVTTIAFGMGRSGSSFFIAVSSLDVGPVASQRWAFLYLPVTQFGMLDDGEGDAVLLCVGQGR